MLALLKFADARMGEPSTWAALAVILGLAHVNVDPGLLHAASLWGAVASGVLGVVLSEVGTKPGGQIAVDAVAALVAAVKAMPDTAKSAAVVLGIAVGLSACTAPQQQTAARVVADGQLFCGIATANGPLVVALADAAGAPVVATGQAAAAVSTACALIGAIPVAPPPVPAQAPVVAAPVV